MKTSVFIAASLEGFFAREDVAIDWLPRIDESGAGEDFGHVLIGRGVLLPGPLLRDVNLRLRESRQRHGGVVQSTYEVA